MEEDRLIDSELDEEEIQYDNKLRPDKLTELKFLSLPQKCEMNL